MKLTYYLVLAFLGLSLMACIGPRASFDYAQDDIVAPSVVDFENTSERSNSYVWDFGDGSSSDEAAPRHRYTRSGQYTVTLKATKGNKTDEMNEEINVKAPNSCLVEITTDMGKMLIELYDDTPLHRDNFLKLAEEGFYDDLLFHRVIDGFMIQGGDPNSRNAMDGAMLGTGGPGYQVDAEFNEHLVHYKGALAAARTGGPTNPQKRSSGSQFYIVQGGPVSDQMLDMVEVRNGIHYSPEQREKYKEVGGTPQLDMEYTVFGRVIDGLDVIDKIASTRTDSRDRPEEDVQMKVQVIK
jgi:peptidyl-prolyl cis-trans isomerase B (cyclophilin B)